ncbi:hypothetical protein [Vibrio cholerae]|uniref:hypothetical protein n=1 Tax=Vibrio cholerae TaxID=666 RepID=UPI00307FFFA4
MQNNLLRTIAIALPMISIGHSAIADTLIKNYSVGPRKELSGVAKIGYPQVCLRTNAPDVRPNLVAIFEELIETKYPSMVIPEAEKLMNDGKLGDVWTVFFDDEQSWKSWSLRKPQTQTADALKFKDWYASPERRFNYQYCVSTKGLNTDKEFISENYIEPLIEKSREIANSLYPDFDYDGAANTIVTSSTWFATELFNKVTGENINHQQKLDWSDIAYYTDHPELETLNSISNPGVVGEVLSNSPKFISDRLRIELLGANGKMTEFIPQWVINHPKHSIHYNKNLLENKNTEHFALMGKPFPFPMSEVKATAIVRGLSYYFHYDGTVSLVNVHDMTKVRKGQTILPGKPFKLYTTLGDLVDGPVYFDPKKIRATFQITEYMPLGNYFSNHYLLILDDGKTYFLKRQYDRRNEDTIIDIDYFDLYAPDLLPYVNRIIGNVRIDEDHLLVYLTGRKYLKVKQADLTIVGKEMDLIDEPLIGKYYKIQ